MTATTAPNFEGLSLAQQYLLTFGGWHPEDKRPQPDGETVRNLVQRGLLIKDRVMMGGVEFPTYTVPHTIYMAWCEHCVRSGSVPKDRRA